jgi:hypothetical protein
VRACARALSARSRELAGQSQTTAGPSLRRARVILLAPWLALAAILALFPNLPPAVSAFLWEFPLLDFPFNSLTLVSLALLVLVAWRYLAAAGRPLKAQDADEVLGFHGEALILQIALAAIVIVILYSDLSRMYPFPDWVAYVTNAGVPRFTASQLGTLLLLFAAAATGLTMQRQAAWRDAPIDERRAAALRNAFNFVRILLIAWLAVTLYPWLLVWTHRVLGPAFFHAGEAVGTNGNNLAALVVVLLVTAISIALLFTFRAAETRAEQFLIGTRPASYGE